MHLFPEVFFVQIKFQHFSLFQKHQTHSEFDTHQSSTHARCSHFEVLVVIGHLPRRFPASQTHEHMCVELGFWLGYSLASAAWRAEACQDAEQRALCSRNLTTSQLQSSISFSRPLSAYLRLIPFASDFVSTLNHSYNDRPPCYHGRITEYLSVPVPRYLRP